MKSFRQNLQAIFLRVASFQAKHHPIPGVHSPDRFREVLERERSRADRTGQRFWLVVFSSPGGCSQQESLPELARRLRGRLRIVDEVGWLDQTRLAVLLPNASSCCRRKVRETVMQSVAAGGALPEYQVYCYPSDAESGSEGEDRHVVRPGRSSDLEYPVDALLVRPLPAWKRGLDIAGAVTGLVVLSPVFGLAALAVKFSSPGSIIFRQLRVGLGGRPFVMYKFRSMVVGAEQQRDRLQAANEVDGPVFKIQKDPRVTCVGRLLRCTSIDELPQLWNVLNGDMSLVGPRPPIHHEVAQYEGWQRRRLEVTPGLTCIWQVSGRTQVSFTHWMRMDRQYIRSRSPWTDLVLILKTIPAVLTRRGAS
jgi:lipopolysaccharide/colanic/teichoic acid biosynthesis glycosyltransferase